MCSPFLEMPSQRPAEADIIFRSIAGGDGEGIGRLTGHAEVPLRKLHRDVLAGFACKRKLKVMDRRRAVHGHGLEHPALDPVDEVRAQPVLMTWPPSATAVVRPSRWARHR